jgi:uncharacterized protein (UPF0333 family)
MKITNKLKNNNKGFSHIEMLLLVVAVVVIGGVGFFVYSSNNKKASSTITAHAGKWTQIDTGVYCTNNSCSTYIPFTSSACYTNAGAYGSYVKALIVLASPTPWPNSINSVIYNWTKVVSGTENWEKTETGSWLYGSFHTSAYYIINTSVNNFIQAYPNGPNNGGLTGNVNNVTPTWVHATGLAAC